MGQSCSDSDPEVILHPLPKTSPSQQRDYLSPSPAPKSSVDNRIHLSQQQLKTSTSPKFLSSGKSGAVTTTTSKTLSLPTLVSASAAAAASSTKTTATTTTTITTTTESTTTVVKSTPTPTVTIHSSPSTKSSPAPIQFKTMSAFHSSSSSASASSLSLKETSTSLPPLTITISEKEGEEKNAKRTTPNTTIRAVSLTPGGPTHDVDHHSHPHCRGEATDDMAVSPVPVSCSHRRRKTPHVGHAPHAYVDSVLSSLSTPRI